MASTYNKINLFVADLANKAHNLGSDQLAVALTDTAPTTGQAGESFAGEISYANISGVNPNYITTTSSTQTSGTYKLILAQLTMTATGNVPPFRYVGIKNTTASKVICWFDYGSEINMISGDQFIVQFDNTNGLLQIA